jgi:electron transport complex protein RnfA
MITLAALGVCASLAMNLLVQFGMGLGILAAEDSGAMDNSGSPQGLMRVLILTGSLFFLWMFFTYVLAPLGPGFYWYLLLCPLSVSLFKGLEQLHKRFFPGNKELQRFFHLPSSGEFLPLGLLIVLHLGIGPLEALLLSLCFSLGGFLSFEVLREIRRRSAMEAAPPFLRSTPLSLISLGLLSLIFTSASLMFFNLFRVGRIG